jgi:TfoX/Sxy family transcriptional regulator of competence genes
MFGGVAFLLNGHMCCGAHKDSLILRLGPEVGELALLEPHTRPMDFTGKVMKGWVIVTSKGVREDDALRRWIEQALAFAATLTGKRRKAPRTRARRS